MRSAPQRIRYAHLTNDLANLSSGVLGRPPRGLDFQRHQARNPARCHLMMVLRLEDFHRVQHLGSQVIEPPNTGRSIVLTVTRLGALRLSTLS
jgi:hypothetical protein